MALQVGQEAPRIEGVLFSGKWTLVYFYPADFTGGCTTEACSFRDNYATLSQKVRIIGVSPDTAESHEKFKTENQLPFELIADPEKKIIAAYGTDGVTFAQRSSFLIDTEGKIAKIFDNVDPDKHAAEVLQSLP